MISATLLGQSVLSGFFAGCLYALLGLGLTLTWRYLKVINLAHFAFVLIAAYLTFQLIGKNELNPLLVSALLIPVFFIAGVGQQALILHYKVNEFASIIVTFGFAMIAEAGLQWFWSADFQKLETHFLRGSAEVGGLFLPMMDILMAAVAFALCIGVWAAMRYTWLGKALRASLDNPQIAAAFGIPNQRLSYLVAGASAAIRDQLLGGFVLDIGIVLPVVGPVGIGLARHQRRLRIDAGEFGRRVADPFGFGLGAGQGDLPAALALGREGEAGDAVALGLGLARLNGHRRPR